MLGIYAALDSVSTSLHV